MVGNFSKLLLGIKLNGSNVVSKPAPHPVDWKVGESRKRESGRGRSEGGKWERERGRREGEDR